MKYYISFEYFLAIFVKNVMSKQEMGITCEIFVIWRHDTYDFLWN